MSPRRCRSPPKRRSSTQEDDHLDQRQRRGASEHSIRTRPVGRHADRSWHHRRPRQRRRRRVRASSRTTRRRARPAARTRGISTASPSPTWRRWDRHRPTTTSTCSRRCRSRPAGRTSECHARRALNMVLKSGSNTPHGSYAHLLRERGPAVEQHAGRSRGVDRRHERQGQPHGPVQGLRLRAWWSAVKDRLWAWGAFGKTHVDIITLTALTIAPSCRTRRSRARSDHKRHSRELHVFPRQQRKVRPRRERDASAERRPGTSAGRRRCTRARPTSSSVATCSWWRGLPMSTAASRSRHAAVPTRRCTSTTVVCSTDRPTLHDRSAAGQHCPSTATRSTATTS